ncbi:MAG: PQ loop repeat family [Trebouxia sp. A1-2]|nr:MAG: PQ loop repeat family [Trebouxia sp. A1-2]
MPHFHCHGDANWFIELYFLDCVYNARDLAGFTFGMASIVCWLVAQVPQFITNIKRQRADALSPWFLAEWLLYIYFQTLQHRRERLLNIPRQRLSPDDPLYRHAVRRPASVDEERGSILLPQQSSTSSRSSGKAPRVLACLAVMLVLQSQWPVQQHSLLPDHHWQGSVMGPGSSRHLMAVDAMAPAMSQAALGGGGNAGRPDWVRTVGTIIGWSSSGFYLGSRLSQIWKNQSRQSAEGLSLAMFACAITANVCYGLGILIRAYSWDVVRSSAPWILGSLGTVSLDIVIFTQGVMFASKKRSAEVDVPPEESQPLFAEQSNAHST